MIKNSQRRSCLVLFLVFGNLMSDDDDAGLEDEDDGE